MITATRAIGQMQGMAAVPAGSPSDLIFDAFREFVRVHQVLLNILIGKAGFLTRVPLVGPPVAAVLRRIEAVVDVSLPFCKEPAHDESMADEVMTSRPSRSDSSITSRAGLRISGPRPAS